MIKFVIDSTAYAPKEYVKTHNISVVPLTVFVQNKEYFEGAQGEFAPIYEHSARQKVLPTTSLPSTQAFVDVFNELLKDKHEIVCLTLASTVSGTCNNAKVAAKQTGKENKISVIDSGSLAQEIYLILQELVEMAENGATRAEIVSTVPILREKVGLFFVPESLNNLEKGGRISLLSAKLGNLMKIKPVLQFKAGCLSCARRVLGDCKAILALLEAIPSGVRKIGILKVSESGLYERLKGKIHEKFKQIPLFTGEVGPVVGTHIGNAYGVCWIL